MTNIDKSLRKALIGGFKRKDVLNYFEQWSSEMTEHQNNLQNELEETRQSYEAACRELEGSKRHETALQEELKALQTAVKEQDASIRELRQTLEMAQQAQAVSGERADTLQREYTALQERSRELETKASAYDLLKNRISTIELEAHQRASQIEDEAASDAAHVRASTTHVLEQVKADYFKVKAELETAIAKTTDDLDRLCRTLERVTDEFGKHGETIDGLLQDRQTEDADKSEDIHECHVSIVSFGKA